MATDVGTLVVGVTADIAGLTKGMADAQSKVQAAGKSMMKAGAGLTAGVTAPIVGIGAASVAAATAFDSSMANVQTLLTDMADGGIGRTQELGAAVQSMAIATGKSTDDLATGLYNVISAFGDTADSVAILDINARAAAAGLATTEQAINLTSAVTKAWGDSSADAIQKTADLAFQTVKLGQTTFPELAASMGRVTGMSKALSVSQEEMFAVMATATGVTGGAAEVSTQLAGIYSGLLAPTGDLADLYAEMGVASGAALVEQEGLQGAIAAIVAAAEASGTPLQKYLGSIEAQQLAMQLAGPLAGDFASKLGAMGTAAGAADAAFQAQTQGINANGFAMAQLKQQMSVVSQEMGGALIPALAAALTAAKPLIDQIVQMAQGFQNLSPRQQQMILGATALAAALGPVLMAVGGLVTVMSAAAPVVGLVGAALGALLSPVGLVVAAVGGLLAVMFNWGGANDKVAASLEKWGLQGAADLVRGLHTGVENLTAAVGGFFSGQTSFSEFFEAAIPEWIGTLFSWVWPVLGPVAWAIKLTAWVWPRMTKPTWISDLLNFKWPGFPTLPGWLGGGGDPVGENFGGTSNWRGGPTWVGERGPEIVDLPRGSRVFPADVSAAMANGQGVTINNYNTLRGEGDIQALAYAVAREFKRGGR